MNKESISVVWLKRDLRLRDHLPLQLASKSDGPVLLLFLVEPILLDDPHYETRHWRFLLQSVEDMNQQLAEFDSQVLVLRADALSAFALLRKHFDVTQVFSHQEIGLANTYERDKQIADYFKQCQIPWQQCPYGAVVRGLLRRSNWKKTWYQRMKSPCHDPELCTINWLNKGKISALDDTFRLPNTWFEPSADFQLGGEKRAWFTLHNFFEGRGKHYPYHLSSPVDSRKACSRLSPYLAWGNISVRQVYQFTLSRWQQKHWKRSLIAFSSRLHWHCHFVQKFESESDMQFRPVNQAYQHYENLQGERKQTYLQAWKEGKTGFPLIDACMRCVIQTGYLNFRMRAMLVSFLCHHLDINWREGVVHLGRQFLDFEPGIHYPQFQMQASLTGINQIRLYNPVKQSLERDPEGIFIRRFVPELAELPNNLLHTPWLLTPMEQRFYQFIPGNDYPMPIIDLELAMQKARDKLWAFQKRDDVQAEGKRILARHTLPDRPKMT